ncbi:hypothetical protein [Colwellia sp. E2M01]|uniref:hypothetical protein n=1 Tax=Colwellia sp. E2M01 TaxID=2841561 RepID=UPI001C090315|nr:hypothetical protein [Colwellia sp. E2M01]MBU2870598.1 hypothetical protein [Colwellia sp. E2M01]
MGALVLGVILVIGYFFESSHPYRRLKLARSTGYHIYFKAGLSGFLFIISSLFIWLCIDYFDIPSAFIDKNNLTTELTYLQSKSKHWDELKAFCIFFLGFILCLIYIGFAKLFSSEKNKYDRIKELANDLELLVINSETNVSPIRLELDNGKVYIGIANSPDLEQGEVTYINLIPLLSGYVDDTKKIIFNNNYYRHYEEHFGDIVLENLLQEAKSFSLVIPVSEIVVASKFDIEAFISFRNAAPSQLVGPPAPEVEPV